LAADVGWIPEGRRRRLEAGGIGFITGNGWLSYGPEWITKSCPDARGARAQRGAELPDGGQPGLQRRPGPVNVFALRTASPSGKRPWANAGAARTAPGSAAQRDTGGMQASAERLPFVISVPPDRRRPVSPGEW
jgi:hypothetical protein